MTPTILVIEDNPSDNRRISDIARDYGMPVTINTTGGALELLQSRHFDVVILDLLLGGTAADTLRALRTALTRTPVVVVTGYEDESIRRDIESTGWAWVQKDASDFNRSLQRALDAAIDREDSAARHLKSTNQLDAILSVLGEVKAEQRAMSQRIDQIGEAVNTMMDQLYGKYDPVTKRRVSGGCVERQEKAMQVVTLGGAWLWAAYLGTAGAVASLVSWFVSKVTQ